MYYKIENNNLTAWADFQFEPDWLFTNIVTAKQLDTHKNIVIVQDGELVHNPNFEQEQAQKERQRLDMLSLTKADVLLALYQDKGLTPENIKGMLADNVPALIKFDYASSYYRGDDVVVALGSALGYTSDEMDYLFENKTFPPNADTDTIHDGYVAVEGDLESDDTFIKPTTEENSEVEEVVVSEMENTTETEL